MLKISVNIFTHVDLLKKQYPLTATILIDYSKLFNVIPVFD